MRLKVILASKQSNDITYDPNLIQELFLRTIERSIAGLYVLSYIKPYLKPGTAESLIRAVTRAWAVGWDRQEKSATRPRK